MIGLIGLASALVLSLIVGHSAGCAAEQTADHAAGDPHLPAYSWDQAQPLHRGIDVARMETINPRPLRICVVRADTMTPGIRFVTTSRCSDWVDGKSETIRQTTRSFLRNSRVIDGAAASETRPPARRIPLVVAVNADAFTPWPAPFEAETATNLLGLAVSDGVLVSPGSGTPSLIVRRNGGLEMRVTGPNTDIRDVETAVSGFEMCLVEGKVPPLSEELNPRTGLGLSRDRRYLVVVTIDGRQPLSWGATKGELGVFLRHFGASDGINMDGGGSTTLACWDPMVPSDDKSRLLNEPVGDGRKFGPESLPGTFRSTERANGNQLGIGFQEP